MAKVISGFSRIFFAVLIAACVLVLSGNVRADDGLKSFPVEIRTWLVTPIEVPAESSVFPGVLQKAVDAGPEFYRQNIANALHWIGYARLRFENDSMRAAHDISSYSAGQITAVGIRMTHEAARKLTPFTLWNVLQLAQSLKTQMPDIFEGWLEMTGQ
ncbi:MAG: hypothetical protein LBC55_00680 [Desulfovibrio sp.]|jgi:hypothetical protein|nr:hypothetical protein [Desulfovibrio sp.]